jgi:hypothetical protein
MNQNAQFETRLLSSPEYVLALHEAADQIAILLRNRLRRQTLQRITAAATVAAPKFQRWLADQNRAGSDVFVGMNPLNSEAGSRTKDNIREIRHLYLDIDEDAKEALANIRDSLDAPPPNFVLDTSPKKHQVIWKVEGLDVEQAEVLLRALAKQFGGDTAATDATRVLRMPGFVNRKYAGQPEFCVQARQESNQVYSVRDFTIRDDRPDFSRHLQAAHSSQRKLPPGHKSQSELDWAYAKRALARGDDPEVVIQRIADFRSEEKNDPFYYARLTVSKAQSQVHDWETGVQQPGSMSSGRTNSD